MRRASLAFLVSVALFLFCLAGAFGAPAAVGKAAAETVRRGWSGDVLQTLGFEDVAFWAGGTLVSSPKKSGAGAVRWSTHTETSSLACRNTPRDLSAFNTMSFWLHSSHANDATFMIIFDSNREKGVFSYYSKGVTVDWTGWKKLEFRFRSFGKARSPAGWDKITSLRLTASGWNQEPNPECVWVLDDLQFTFDAKPYRPNVQARTYVKAPVPERYLTSLRKSHPRLILLDEDLPRIRAFLANDPRGQSWLENTRKRAEQYYRRPPRHHELPDGRRLLSVSRDVCNRIYHWGLLYRLEKDPKWLERAWEELKAVVAFKDWNPSHYLDTAEMMHGVGVGYDWFYNGFTEDQRKTIREGLWQHGLRLSYAAYMGLEAEGQQGWRHVTNNWNFVCNGGTSLGAMAVLDEMPEECTVILDQAFRYIQIPVEHFEPDGAWWEGISYWGYSMRYFLAYLRGLETAFGTDFGFIKGLKGTGFSMAGDFPVHLVSPLGGYFNFADSGSGGGTYRHWALFYLAARFRNPLYLDFQRRNASGDAYDILYYEPFEAELALQDVALDKCFKKTEVATMRSSWTDRNALFAGIKCGRNGIAHAHQDLGSFIFYGLGERWVLDLGTEGQTYQSHKHRLPRHHFYRIREEGHNTLVFNPGEKYSQDGRGKAVITRFESSAKDVFAVADLTHAYRKHAKSVRRGYRLLNHRRAFLVQDEIQGNAPSDLWWFGHSFPGIPGEVGASGKQATLKVNGKTCHACLLSPEGARFAFMDARPLPTSPDPDIQQQNKGATKLAVHLPETEDVTIAVAFAPVYDFEEEPSMAFDVTPLETWEVADSAGPALSAITVDGRPLGDFSARVYTYAVMLPPDTQAVPVVTVEADADVCDTNVASATAFPGTTRIAVTAKLSGASSVYLVRFLPTVPPGGSGKPHFRSKPVVVNGVTVSASRDDGNRPGNVLDGDPETRWSASGEKEWIAFDLGERKILSGLNIAWYNGNQRRTSFEVHVSMDGRSWREVFKGQSTGKDIELEHYTFNGEQAARHVRITCFGNTSNLWNSITEIGF